jgi:hypothetical protein
LHGDFAFIHGSLLARFVSRPLGIGTLQTLGHAHMTSLLQTPSVLIANKGVSPARLTQGKDLSILKINPG